MNHTVLAERRCSVQLTTQEPHTSGKEVSHFFPRFFPWPELRRSLRVSPYNIFAKYLDLSAMLAFTRRQPVIQLISSRLYVSSSHCSCHCMRRALKGRDLEDCGTIRMVGRKDGATLLADVAPLNFHVPCSNAMSTMKRSEGCEGGTCHAGKDRETNLGREGRA